MESPIKRITEDQIRKLVSESKNPINPLSMVFAYEYVSSLIPLHWNDLLFAIENGFLTYQTAIEHAIEEMQKNENQPIEVLELACKLQSEANFQYDIYNLVEKLASSHDLDNAPDSKEKFLYVSLNWVYERRADYCNPIEVVDILCDDLDSPDEAKKLLSFMPVSQSESNLPDSPTERLYNRLELYLENQRKRWTPVMKH